MSSFMESAMLHCVMPRMDKRKREGEVWYSFCCRVFKFNTRCVTYMTWQDHVVSFSVVLHVEIKKLTGARELSVLSLQCYRLEISFSLGWTTFLLGLNLNADVSVGPHWCCWEQISAVRFQHWVECLKPKGLRRRPHQSAL